jgi:polyhydroxybutyrate depolymerase
VALGLVVLVAACSSGGSERSSSRDAADRATPACPGSSSSDVESGVRTMQFGDTERQYTLHLPPGYDGRERLPVILNLHGFTSNMDQQDTVSNLPEMAGERGYAVVTPQALEADIPVAGGSGQPFWNIIPLVAPAVDVPTQEVPGVTDDIAFLAALLDEVERELCVDTTREFVTGMSNGGAMTAALACEYDDRFAAVAPVAGINIVKVCDATEATPLIVFHGDADGLVPYEGGGMFGYELGLPSVEQRVGEIAKLGACAEPPTETEVADDVTRLRWKCPAGMGAELYKVLGGGHTWPGAGTYVDAQGTRDEAPPTVGHETGNLVATELMLDFFDAHRR